MSLQTKQTFREAFIILIASTLLGFSYSWVMNKGAFVPSSATTESKSEVAPVFISFEEAKASFDANGGLFVDARHEYDYKLGHIKGAINVPLRDFDLTTSPLANTPKGRLIITYCDGVDCNSSVELAQKLSEVGFTNVKMFFGGWNEWQQRHLEVER